MTACSVRPSCACGCQLACLVSLAPSSVARLGLHAVRYQQPQAPTCRLPHHQHHPHAPAATRHPANSEVSSVHIRTPSTKDAVSTLCLPAVLACLRTDTGQHGPKLQLGVLRLCLVVCCRRCNSLCGCHQPTCSCSAVGSCTRPSSDRLLRRGCRSRMSSTGRPEVAACACARLAARSAAALASLALLEVGSGSALGGKIRAL